MDRITIVILFAVTSLCTTTAAQAVACALDIEGVGDSVNPSVAPAPASVWLLDSGQLELTGITRKRTKPNLTTESITT
jgi:hypothetical protein